MQTKKQGEVNPAWLSMASAGKYAGICKRQVEIWDRKGFIKTARVVTPGNVRGRTLVCRESLDGFIQSYVGKAPAAIAMNSAKVSTGGNATR